MSKVAKIWIIIAASLLLFGIVIFGGVMTMAKWDFKILSTNKIERNKHEIDEEFKDISISTDTADIKFVRSEDTKCSVVCDEEANLKHSVTVKDGSLVIELVDTRKWYEHIGINFGKTNITVYLPEGEYSALSIKSSTGDVEIAKDFKFRSIDISTSTGDVANYASALGVAKIKASTGDITVQNVSAGVLDLSVTTGRVTLSGVVCEGDVKVGVSTGKSYLTNVECKSVTSSGDTGDITLNNVIAAEKFSIERSTGDVSFERCDAAEIFVKTDTGDVKGSLLTDKVFLSKTDTGRINVPNSITGGRCEITTDTGDIRITVN